MNPVSYDSNREYIENELAKIRQFADLSRWKCLFHHL